MTELEHKAEEIKNEIKEHLEEENQSWGLGLVKNFEKEIEELKWEQKQILDDNEFYQKENEELKAQIEKMKCCGNCIHHSGCLKKLSIIYLCDNLNKWELA